MKVIIQDLEGNILFRDRTTSITKDRLKIDSKWYFWNFILLEWEPHPEPRELPDGDVILVESLADTWGPLQNGAYQALKEELND